MTAPIVTVRGEAQLTCPPDRAEFTISAIASGSSQERVRSDLASTAAALQDQLAGFEAALAKSSTSGFQLSPTFDRRAGTKITGYRGSFSTTVTVSDFEVLPALIAAASSVPNSEINGPWWSLLPDNPVHREVRLAAIEDAMRRARDYAAAFDATIVDLIEVSDLEASFPAGRAMPLAARQMAQDVDFDFDPAVQTVSGQITVRVTITTPNLTGA